MRSSLFLGLVLAAAAFGQTEKASAPAKNPTPAQTPGVRPDTVVATIDGRKFTAGEFDAIANSFQGLRQNMMTDPKTFLERYGVLIALTKMAESNGLDKTRPYKERLEYSRMQILWQALIDRKYDEFEVTAEETKKYFEANKDKYVSVKVRAVYIPFSPAPPPQTDPKAKKILTEAEALAQANEVVKKARAGTDFVQLVKEYSQDSTSTPKGGEFGTFKKSDNMPEHIRKALFSLKTGEVSDPVRQPNGFYVFRADEAGQQDYDHAAGTIISEIRDHKLQEWLQGIGKATKTTIENEAYFSAKPVPSPPK